MLNIPPKSGQHIKRMYKRSRLPLVIPPLVGYWPSGGDFFRFEK